MKCSVIVPVYNMAGDGKLEYCLNSLVGQTMEDLEIIAVDDASTDNSLEVLKQFEQKYPGRFKALHYSQNKRQGGAKNEGLKIATGEWIGFIDSDDWVTPDYYEKLIAKAEETGADVVGCHYNLVHEHTMEVGQIIRNNMPDQAGECTLEQKRKLALRPGSMVIKVYRHSMIQEHQLNFPEGIFYEDNCAGTVWMLYCNRFELLDEPMYYYYQHDVSTVHYISEAKCMDRIKSGELLAMECAARGFMEDFRPEIEYRFTEIYYATTLFSYMQGVKRPKLAFTALLRDGIRQYFPNFRENSYYTELMGDAEKKLIDLHMKSNLAFFVYYRLMLLKRKLRK